MTATRAGAPDLAAGYAECARLTRRHGTTYYWGARLLRPDRRRHVHAVYALCRLADDIVDAPGATIGDAGATRAALTAFRGRFEDALAGSPAPGDDVLAAVARTVRECRIDPACFDRFFGAMAMDLEVDRYETFDDLCGYMDGSAAVIGEMMLPVLEPVGPGAYHPARTLGLAFQLTNFLRDVGEDLDRGRVYLPQADLRRFGADPARRVVDDAWRAVMRHEIDRARELYRQAEPGIAVLPPRSARCVATAHTLYAGILGRIEARDYDVFSGRARVPTPVKALTALRVLVGRPATGPAPAGA
ncbi:MAG: phytoene/squalene synthase family protein [Propionicimonas sp.]|nr:phytoene/squalene synthase family protein [Propionicimonas sp.]